MLIIQLTAAALLLICATWNVIEAWRLRDFLKNAKKLREFESQYHKELKKNLENTTAIGAWITRDKDHSLWLFSDKPSKSIGGEMWIPADDSCECFPLDSGYFPDLTYENSPREVIVRINNLNTL